MLDASLPPIMSLTEPAPPIGLSDPGPSSPTAYSSSQLSLLLTPISQDKLTAYTSRVVPSTRTRGRKRGKDDEQRDDDWDMASSPTLPALPEKRALAPLRSSVKRRAVFTPLSHSRESSPPRDLPSSPIKRPRTTSISGDIMGFHLSSDDESDSDMPSSPNSRCRSRFNHLLGPSPLQKSFSSTCVPRSPTASKRIHMDRAISAPIGHLSPGVKTRAKALLDKQEVENLGTEMNKVFALVHGKGLGMGSTGSMANRRGSSLRPRHAEKEAREGKQDMEVDE